MQQASKRQCDNAGVPHNNARGPRTIGRWLGGRTRDRRRNRELALTGIVGCATKRRGMRRDGHPKPRYLTIVVARAPKAVRRAAVDAPRFCLLSLLHLLLLLHGFGRDHGGIGVVPHAAQAAHACRDVATYAHAHSLMGAHGTQQTTSVFQMGRTPKPGHRHHAAGRRHTQQMSSETGAAGNR